jgi:hypothetical protein
VKQLCYQINTPCLVLSAVGNFLNYFDFDDILYLFSHTTYVDYLFHFIYDRTVLSSFRCAELEKVEIISVLFDFLRYFKKHQYNELDRAPYNII